MLVSLITDYVYALCPLIFKEAFLKTPNEFVLEAFTITFVLMIIFHHGLFYY